MERTVMTIAEVGRELVRKAAIVRQADNDIARLFRRVERAFEQRGIRRLVRARIVAGVELAWSRSRSCRWRLVIVDDSGATDVLNVEPDERVEAITTGALEQLLRQVTP
jgi:hypothetical protein